jgi:hypothetical protein
MRNVLRLAFAVCLLVGLARPAFSQSRNTGEIRGTVTDASNAVVPDASVVLTNVDTGVKNDFTTNKDGIYDTITTPTGNYTITVTAKGFKTVVIGPFTLDVAVITEDAKLEIGTPTETVTVTSTGVPLLQTESGQQGAVLEDHTVAQLPQQGAGITGNDWANFNIFLPGASSAPSQPGSEGSGNYNAGDAVSINGNLPNYANFLQDGAVVQLPVSNNVDNLVFEAVQEVQINTSAFSAEYGVGGAVFNQISKSGANSFHGSLYEFWQNNFLNASNFFGGATPFLRYDEYGGSVGGPIMKNKLFFYFDIDKIYNNGGSSPQNTEVPTCAERGLATTSPTACGAALGYFDFTGLPTLYDPTTSATAAGRVAFMTENTGALAGKNAIPLASEDPVAAKLLAFYPMPNAAVGSVSGCSLCNYTLTTANANPNLRFVGRIDYNMSDKNHLSGSVTEKNNAGVNNNNGTPCPINCFTGDITGLNIQITDAYTISPNMVNELRMGYTMQGNYFVPQTVLNGFNPTTALGLAYSKANVFPTINIGPGGGVCCKQLAPGTNAIYIEHLYDPSDTITLIKGRHILHFGVEVLMGEGNTTPWGSINAGTFGFGPGGATPYTGNGTSGTGFGLADFLLGDVENWGATNQVVSYARLKNPQAFVQDDWKIKPNFTLNLGLRYQGTTGFSEKNNSIGGFDPNATLNYDCVDATLPSGAANPNVGKCGAEGSLGAMWFAGQLNRTTSQKPIWDIFLPRVGFAWSFMHNTVLRGGFGMYSYNFSQDVYGQGIGAGSLGTSSGSATDPGTGTGNPLIHLDSTLAVANAALPYVVASRNPVTYVNLTGLPGETVVPYNVSPGRIREYEASIEHQFAGNYMVTVAYAGSQGSNLSFPMDLNQITNPATLAAEVLASPPNGITIKADRPYPAWGGLGDNTYNGISNYNAMQLAVEKRYSSGLSFEFNYVWSHFLDSQDSAGWGNRGGTQLWQNGSNPAANYGNSNFNVPNAFKGYVVYELPFGHGKQFLSNGSVVNEIAGGWQISGTFIAQSGNPFTVTDSSAKNLTFAGSIFPNITGNPYSSTCPTGTAAGTICWLNPAAFSDPAPGTFGNEQRNSLVGPRLTVFNLSFAKSFAFTERFNLQLKMDMVNAFNHPSFTTPQTTFSSTSVGNLGQIQGVAVGARTIQLGARFSF